MASPEYHEGDQKSFLPCFVAIWRLVYSVHMYMQINVHRFYSSIDTVNFESCLILEKINSVCITEIKILDYKE